MRIAFYTSERDNVPKSAELAWGQLVEILTAHKMTDCLPCAGHDCAAKFGRAWSPVDIGDTRGNAHVRSVNALVLDFDGLTEAQARDALTRLAPYEHIIYSTHSHAPERGVYSFRGVVQLSRPVPAAQWRGFLVNATNAIGIANFPGIAECKDLSRLYFLPTAPVGARTCAGAEHGAPMDVDAILALAPHMPTSNAVRLMPAPLPVAPHIPAPVTVELEDLRKRLKGVRNEASKQLAQDILNGTPVGWSEAQRRAGAPQVGRNNGLQRAASLVAWACPLGTPVPALFELMRPSFNAMDHSPKGTDFYLARLTDMLERAVAGKAAREAQEEQAHKDLIAGVFGPDYIMPVEAPRAPNAPAASASAAYGVTAPSAPALSLDPIDELTAMAEAGQLSPLDDGGDDPPTNDWSREMVWRTDKEGNRVGLKNTIGNVGAILKHDKHWKGLIKRNEFTGGVELWGGPIFNRPPVEPVPLTDELVTEITMWLQQRPEGPLRIEVGTSVVYEAVNATANLYLYNPLRDYLDGVQWDGTPRLDSWLERYMGARTVDAAGDDITSYVRAIASKWLIAAVARTYEPGCKVQNVLILEGDQGLRKSTALEVLASRKFFTDAALDIGNKDTAVMTTRTWIVELAELDAFRKSENTQAKAFFTRDWEEYRPPYGRTMVKRPRVCIFAGTSNRDDYLTDPTGNRRYWPVFCTKVDLAALRADRDQIWAEAKARYQAGRASDEDCLWWLTKPEEAIAYRSAEERVASDDWDEPIIRWWAAAGRQNDVRTSAVLEVAIGIPKERLNHASQSRVGACMKRLGFVKKRKRDGGRLIWFYEPGPSLAEIPVQTPIGVNEHLSLFQGGA